jgi:membrane-associated protease RseP (regulator of RpoE activity)
VKRMKSLAPICVLVTLLALPTLAQDTPQPFAKSYVDITQEQAWNAVGKAVREMSGVFGKKTDILKEKVEFEKNFPGLPRGKFVRFKVHVAQTTDGRIQVTATPTKVEGLPKYPLPSEAQMEALADEFFGLVAREIGIYWSNTKNQNAAPSPFASFRSSLIGVNEVARTALPVWLEPNGETVFPTAFSKARTGDTLTITNIVLCGRYPVREIASECGTEAVGNRLVVVVLFNGAQPRLLPSPRPVQGGNTATAFGNMLDSFVCIFGKAIDCIQANQRTDIRELEGLQSTMQHSSAEASWGMSELQKFEQTGPEIAFEVSSRDFSTQANLSGVIKEHLSRFVEMGPASTSRLTSQTGKYDVATAVAIKSVPDGAEIYLDGNFAGNTPSTLNVPYGEHSVTLRKAKFQNWVREMAFSGGTITLSAELVPDATPPASVPANKQFTTADTAAFPAHSGNSSVKTPSGWIGISSNRAAGGGFLVSSFSQGSPASKAGLKIGDVITELNGVRVGDDEELESQIARYAPGSEIRIGYVRGSWAFKATVIVGRISSY